VSDKSSANLVVQARAVSGTVPGAEVASPNRRVQAGPGAPKSCDPGCVMHQPPPNSVRDNLAPHCPWGRDSLRIGWSFLDVSLVQDHVATSALGARSHAKDRAQLHVLTLSFIARGNSPSGRAQGEGRA
jgi:hypothetical protein